MVTATHDASFEGISTLNEKALHAALKAWYAKPGDKIETPVAGFIIDIVRDNLLIEIQTRNFSAIKRKLLTLTGSHPVHLIYPIAKEKWIVKQPQDGQGRATRRKSPKRGRIEMLFDELVSFPQLLADDNFTLEVLFIQEEEVRRYTPQRNWRRRGWVTDERRLLEVVECRSFASPNDMLACVPGSLPETFTTTDLAAAASLSRRLAQKMAYCLREMGVFKPAGKRGRAILYTLESIT